MKQLTWAEKEYYHEKNGAELDTDRVHTFRRLLGQQALYFVDLIRARAQNNMSGLHGAWKNISALNGHWVDLVMRPYAAPTLQSDCERHQRFCNVAQKIIYGYTEVMGQLLVDGKVGADKLQQAIDLESRFFSWAPKKHDSEEETRQHWMRYTDSLITTSHLSSDLLENSGNTPDSFYVAARRAIVSAQLLGSWLDVLIF